MENIVNKNNLEPGVHAAGRVLSIDGDDSATHVLLANLYAVAGKWDSVKRMRVDKRAYVGKRSWSKLG